MSKALKLGFIPWTAIMNPLGIHQVVDSQGYVVANVLDQNHARAIAAAPEMYEVLRKFEIELARTNSFKDITLDVVGEMLVALRKAEGSL